MAGRAVDLICQLSEACHAATTLRAAAASTARALADHFPDSSAIVFEQDAGEDTLRAVAGANIPVAWQMRAVPLREVPMLREALRTPRRLVRGIAGADREAICGAVPDPVKPTYALMFIAAQDPAAREDREVAIESARQLLAAAAQMLSGGAARTRTAAAIHHAKIEWETAADALPELFGLVDRRRRVVRVNRAAERWSSATVQAARGRDLHQLLHPGCAADDCEPHARLAQAWPELIASGRAAFEFSDPARGLDCLVRLSAADNRYAPRDEQPWQRAAFFVSDATALRAATRAVATLNGSLEQRIVERTLELTGANRVLREEVARRAGTERSLRGSQLQLEALSTQLMNAQEEERKRIARDLHDSIGQSLSAIKYSLERAQVLVRRQEPEAAAVVVESAVGRVQRAIEELRGIAMNLRPAQLDDLGAASAVRWLCREWQAVYSDIAVQVDIAVDDAQVPPLLATNVFRTVQESLNNVARHSAARHVAVALWLDDGTLSVTVCDDGSGFSLDGGERRSAVQSRLGGLAGLHERAERSGGRCDVSSAPGRGTAVRVDWPLVAGLAAHEVPTCIN